MSAAKLEAAILHYPYSEDRKDNPGIIAGLLGVEVVLYQDFRKLGPWESAKYALKNIRSDHTHLLMLENDVVPCVNMFKAAETIAEYLPEEIVSFWCGAPAATKAYQSGKNLFRLPGSLSGQALMIPKSAVEPMLRWAEVNEGSIKNAQAADVRVFGYLASLGRRVAFTGPSLVEHIGVKSTMGNAFRGHNWAKISGTFPGLEFDAMSIDWLAAAVELRAYDRKKKWPR